MNYAIVLAGGSGTRLGEQIPKQFLCVNNRPIISYSIEKLQQNKKIDKIVVVASMQWKDYIEKQIREDNITKMIGIAEAGKSRQHSILSGLQYMKEYGAKEDDIVLIHDAARPNVTEEIINKCMEYNDDEDGAMPVLPISDTVYVSKNGDCINDVLKRDELFAGQTPESFRFGMYYKINCMLSDEELLNIHGSSEAAYKGGMRIRLFDGSKHNYKITTIDDFQRFCEEQSETSIL